MIINKTKNEILKMQCNLENIVMIVVVISVFSFNTGGVLAAMLLKSWTATS